MPSYKKTDFKSISWEEYGNVIERLYKKVNAYIKKKHLNIDAVVPILRGGGFSGMFLAYKLHIIRILPVQYKYITNERGQGLRQLIKAQKLFPALSKKPTFLLVENNHCFGHTAVTACEDLRSRFSGCKVIYATAYMDYSSRCEKEFDKVFYGMLTNETRGLSKKEAQAKGISNNINLYPWENIKEEMAMVNGKPFTYK